VIADEYSSMTCICHAKFFARWPQDASAYYMIMVGLTRSSPTIIPVFIPGRYPRSLPLTSYRKSCGLDRFPTAFLFFSLDFKYLFLVETWRQPTYVLIVLTTKPVTVVINRFFFSNMVKYINSRMNWFFSRQSAEHR